MALKRILAATYVGQTYIAVIGIVTTPLYLRYLGAEAYGLVGFFVMMQIWLQLLDMGLTPTLSRELARYRGGTLDGLAAWCLVRSLEWILGTLALVFMAVAWLLADWISVHWFKSQITSTAEIADCILIMGTIASLRWLVGLYRGGLIGLEKQLWVNGAQIILATVKSVGALFLLIYVSSTPRSFFLFQLFVVVFELFLFRQMFYRNMPKLSAGIWPDRVSLRRNGKFAGAMASTTAIWAIITQADKLILSYVLTLEEYGYFTLAVVAANGIALLTSPLTQALQPHFTVLVAQWREEELINLYRTTTQFVVAFLAAAAGLMALFAEPILLAWTGEPEAGRRAASLLCWYTLGNGVAALLSIPFMLQFARGDLRLHVLGTAIFAVVWIPCVWIVILNFGPVGAGIAWLVANLIFLLIWVPRVHARVAPSLTHTWLIKDVASIVGAVGLMLILLSAIDVSTFGRLEFLIFLAVGVVVVGCVGLLAGDRGREIVLRRITHATSA